MQTIQDYVPITQAKNKLLDMVRSIHDSDNAIAITKNGVPKAVLISMEKFQGLLETIEILADDEARAQIKQSRDDVKHGHLIDMKELF